MTRLLTLETSPLSLLNLDSALETPGEASESSIEATPLRDWRSDQMESDLRRVQGKDKVADFQFRSELDALSAVLETGHEQLSSSVATLSVAFAEFAQTGLAASPSPAPGLGCHLWPTGCSSCRAAGRRADREGPHALDRWRSG